MIVKVIGARQPAMAGSAAPAKRASDVDLGRSMRGLIAYVVGPGVANEHTSPTLVAGSEPLFSEFADTRWDDRDWQAGEVSALAKQLNRPMLRKRIAGELPEDRAWVMHTVISMEPGTLMDHSMWEQVARDYVSEMELDESGGKAGCRWVAFHHGQTVEGNDHIHLAVMMIRDDGTWASTWRSKQRSQQARRSIEERYGLTPAEQAAQQRDRPAFSVVDAHRNTEQTPGQPQPKRLVGTDNEKLRRLMVSALGKSESEADYVKHLWAAGVLTVPRYAQGTTDVIVGYKVALRPDGDQPPLWHAAGKVHRSLTLTHVRSQFVDDPAAALEAAAMWRRVDPAVGARPPADRRRDGAAAEAARHIAEVNRLAGELTPDQIDRWALLARDTAGVWSAAAAELEPEGRGPLSRAAEATWRDGAVLDPTIAIPARPPQHQGLGRAARLLMQSSRNDLLGWLAVVEQLAHTNEAIAAARLARHDRDNADYLLRHTRDAVAQQRDTTTAATATAAATLTPTPQRGGAVSRTETDRSRAPDR